MALTAVKTTLNQEPFASKIAQQLDVFSAAVVADMTVLAGGATPGVSPEHLVRLKTTGVLTPNPAVYDSTALTLTGASNGALTVDSVTAAVGDRIFVDQQATGGHNGIYRVTAIGGAGKWSMVRDFDWTTGNLPQLDAIIGATEGTVGAGLTWQLSFTPPYALGTTGTTTVPYADPATGTPGAVGVTAAAVGSSLLYARTDHVHQVNGVNGASVPAAGALTTGNAPYVSGASALTYSALNLAGGVGWVSGLLPRDSVSVATYQARGISITNVASLAAFVVANNGITYAANDYVLLTNQTAVAENGLYKVGTVAGTAPLTRAAPMATGAAIVQGTTILVGAEGTVGKNTTWTSTALTGKIYNTDDPLFVCKEGNCLDMLSTATGTQTAPTNVFVAGVVMVAKISGIFQVDIDVSYSTDTTGETTIWTFLTDTSASGVLAGANNVAHGISGVTAGIGTIAAAGATCDTNGGAAVTYNAAAWTTAPVVQKTDTTAMLVGLLTLNGSGTNKFEFHGRVYNAVATGTTKTPFTIGNTVGFGIKVTNAHVVTMPSINIRVTEVAAG